MIVGYARVSSTAQSLDLQKEALVAAGVEKLFHEKRSATTTEKRDELGAALAWAREGDVLVVTRLDRLARSVVDLWRILKTLSDKGVGFRCLQQPIDTTRPEGRLMRSVMGAVAEFEAELIRERQKDGIERARLEGKYGRPNKLDPELIRRLHKDEKLGAAAIARKLKVSRPSVYRSAPGIWGEPVIQRGEQA